MQLPVIAFFMWWKKKTSVLDKVYIKKHSLKVWLNAVLPPVLWATVIFLFSSRSTLPSAPYSSYDFILKKIAHITVFAILFVLTNRSFSMLSARYELKKHWYLPVLICLLYALSDEIHQYFVPNRHASLRDVGFDMLGVFSMYLRKTNRV